MDTPQLQTHEYNGQLSSESYLHRLKNPQEQIPCYSVCIMDTYFGLGMDDIEISQCRLLSD